MVSPSTLCLGCHTHVRPYLERAASRKTIFCVPGALTPDTYQRPQGVGTVILGLHRVLYELATNSFHGKVVDCVQNADDIAKHLPWYFTAFPKTIQYKNKLPHWHPVRHLPKVNTCLHTTHQGFGKLKDFLIFFSVVTKYGYHTSSVS